MNGNRKHDVRANADGTKNYGICDDTDTCPIPPRYCGEPIRTRQLLDDRDDNVDIEQMPWMVSLGTIQEIQGIQER